MVKVSIVSAYIRQFDMTKEFLKNLIGKIPIETEVIMVNASGKPGLDFETDMYNYKRIDLEENISFSHSMNTGIREATGEYVLMMGNDGFINEGDVGKLLETFDIYEGVFISTGNTSNPGKRYAAPYFIRSLTYGFEEYSFVPAIYWMMSRECLDTVGLFDENFIIGQQEDLDYAIRVNKHKGRIIMRDDICITHLCSQEVGYYNMNELNKVNLEYLKEKHNLK